MDKASDKIVIKFNCRLYTTKAIRQSIVRYSDFADFSLAKKGNYYQVAIANINKDVTDIMKDEFCNFVLHMMKTN